jgi:cation:H+ antiporter
LVRGAAGLARRLGLAPLAIGLTVVAFGTSMPELVVSVSAGMAGQGDIATGNVVGSNIANIALILGFAALIRPLAVHTRVVRFDIPVVVAVSALLMVFLSNQFIGRLEGVVLLTGLIAYTVFSLRLARSQSTGAQQVFPDILPQKTLSLPLGLCLVLGGLALLVAGARLLVSGAVTIAEAAGMSQAIIGLTVVAVGTSLPELATSLLAALKKEGDIAVGNIVGSNIFNILGILGTASVARPLEARGIGWVDSGLMIGLALAMLPLARSGCRISRIEGFFLISLYAGYLVYLLL